MTHREADLIEQLGLSILASGLSDWVSLLQAVGHAQLLGLQDLEEALTLTVAVVEDLAGRNLIRVGDLGESGRFREVEADMVESVLSEAEPRFHRSNNDQGEWQWYLWMENTEAGNRLARETDAQSILWRLGTA